MKRYITIIGSIIGIAILGIVLNVPNKALGSVPFGNGYMYKTITTSNASSTAPTVVRVRGGAGILGSIVVASSSNKALNIYDGLTSTTTGTLITTLKASVSEQTFTYDANVLYGIIIDMPQTFTGVYTVTYR